MANVTFRLKEPNKQGKTLIYLYFYFRGMSLKFSTGENIEPENWSLKKQLPKKNNITTSNGKHSLSDFLARLGNQCEKLYNESLRNGIPSPELIKKGLREYIDSNAKEGTNKAKPNTLYNLIDRFIDGEILYEGRKRSPATIKTYTTVKNHLSGFEKAKRYPINFDTIDITFFDKFNDYLISKSISANGRSKYIKTLKVFMNEGVERDLTDNLQYRRKRFNVKRIETESTYLSTGEILALYKHDLSAQPYLERVRDLFVFGCFVGLRFSDFSRIKPSNIIQIETETFIKIATMKTGELVIIPTNPIILEILRKYKGKTPPSPSGQKFNEYIKLAAKAAELTEVGRLSKDPDKPLYQCIASHTARRSFATNLYLEGFPVYDIMKITGHRSERSFMQYIKVTKEQSAKRLSEHIKHNWSGKLLKLVS